MDNQEEGNSKCSYKKECLINCLTELTNIPVNSIVKFDSFCSYQCLNCIKPILHFLKCFGVIDIQDDSFKIRTIEAKSFIKILIEYIENDIEIIEGWDEIKGKPVSISDKNILFSKSFLYAIEKKRIDRLKECAKPIRTNKVSKIIFKAKINNKERYLMQYDSRAHQYKLIGGYQKACDKNSFDAVLREIIEELPEANFELHKNIEITQVLETTQLELSSKYCIYSEYNITVFYAYNIDMKMFSQIDKKLNSWVSWQEIKEGIARDQKQIYPNNEEILNAMKKLNYSIKSSRTDIRELLDEYRIQIVGLLLAIGGLLIALLSYLKN
jgi:hypothetical protein